MQPTKIDHRQEDIFKGRLSNELNPKHEMMILARLIPWDSLESEFSDLYQSNGNAGGQPPKPIRLMIGILLLHELTPFFKQPIPLKPMSGIIHNF